ncbi:hypothetical protein ACGFY7_40705 [Streptomyces prunicolor]|uniref:hypothetical protein n=1 Tax=Streptomyces prunicolor TaxID=67348 RepID=UPI00372431D4
MASQSARGLSQWALLPSGVHYAKDPALGQPPYGCRTFADAETNGAAFAAYLGCSASPTRSTPLSGAAGRAPSTGPRLLAVRVSYVLPAADSDAKYASLKAYSTSQPMSY